MKGQRIALVVVAAALIGAGVQAQDTYTMKRTASGKPDLSGVYDGGSLTPLNRPEEYGDKQFMTREEAEKINRETAERVAAANAKSDPDRGAPVLGGGAVKTGGGGGTGGYNSYWVDPGSAVVRSWVASGNG